jgi:hypothetical protein
VNKLLLLVVFLLSTVCLNAQQRDWSQVQMKATKVAGNVYMLEGVGGNIGVSVGADGILIVDDQFAPLADKIRASLKELGQGKLRFILNTHWHGDHRRKCSHRGGDGQCGRDGWRISWRIGRCGGMSGCIGRCTRGRCHRGRCVS